MAKQPFQLLRAEQAYADSCFTKTKSGLEVLEYCTDILLVDPAKVTAYLPKTGPALALPGEGTKHIAPFTKS